MEGHKVRFEEEDGTISDASAFIQIKILEMNKQSRFMDIL